MASDLGAWPAEQATVLVEVLQRDGLQPEAKRTREGILVTVPDEQSDQAHQVLAANMDVIAQAARPRGPGARRRGRSTARPSPQPRREPDRDTDARLTSERLLRAGPVIVLLLVALLVAGLVRQLAFPIILGAVIAGVWLLGKQTQREQDD
ncbi:hypothetical protein [Egicoccus halophilus]|uniref:Uncharacterized protein n=1 Tax=Egicoccus halophilus TaxID=1670830 RepID=A0A8J3ABB2_9ACTN|nr:hypothetical protein [Egicoccus halophilus]GGI07279.1 hypothetical protein GCM10011354_23290 [Egicoccus halophilus]